MSTDTTNLDETKTTEASEAQPILDRNIELLLTRAHEPPRMRPQARASVLATLKARTSGTQAPPAANVTALPSRRTVALAVGAVVAIAAAVLLAVGLRTLSSDETTDEGGAVLERIANEDAAPRRVALPDGSSVVLRRGAAIERVGPRSIRLVDGEVLVDVAPSEEPFVVHTEHGRAVALGTRFTVRRIVDAIDAAVVRGTVRIENEGGEAMLGAGEHGRLASATAPSKHLGERLSHELSWAHDALSELDDAPKPPVRRGNLVARDQWSEQDWPLPMRELVVDVHVEDGIARTTIDQTFFNHTQRQLEGVYSFPLPTDAAISRLAMYVDGKLMEGGIVERQRGRDVYESIVYQRRDPALLEWMKGSEFRVRIFPLPARTEKRILLSYTQPLPSSYGEQQLTVPIPEIDLPVDVVEYHVHVEGSDLTVESDSHPLESYGDHDVVFVAKNHTIGDDLRLTLRGEVEPDRGRIVGHSDDTGDYAMVRAQPTLTQSAGHVARSWVVLYDTSASRNPSELVAQGELLRQFLHQMDEGDRVSVVAFDTEVRAMTQAWSRVDALDPATLDAFLTEQARIAAGATDLGAALDDAVARLASETQAPHILILGDGTATDGIDAIDELRDRVQGKATVVAASIGDGTDTRTLEALADATGGMTLSLQPGEDLGWRAFETISTLNGPRLLDVKVTLLDADGTPIPDVDPLVPHRTLAHGEGLTVLARGEDLAVTAGAVKLEGQLAGSAWSQTLPLTAESRPAAYLPRLWAQAQIEAWLEDDATAHQQEITELGMKRFLITPYTSLLVLENDAMYEQFEVTRPKATDWAHYESPATIKVVYEPMGTSPLDGLFVDASTRILRDPVPMLSAGGSVFLPSAGEGLAFGLGLRGTGRGGGGLGKSGLAIDTVTLDLADVTTETSDVDEDMADDLRLEAEQTIVSSRSSSSHALDYRREASTRAAPVQEQQARRRRAGPVGGSVGWWGRYGYGHTALPTPMALHYASDWRLDDPTHFVPGMLADDYDYARERLLADPTFPEGSIDDDARRLVREARDALSATRYELEDGTVLVVDAQGRFARTTTTPEGLVEQVVYDGDDAWALYEELGLGVRRRIGPTAPLLLTTSVPWVLPSAEHLARWYDVTTPRERTLRLVRAADPDGEATEIELDADGRVVAITRGGIATRMLHAADGITITTGAASLKLTRTAGATTIPAVDESAWTIAELPLRTDDHWEPQLAGLEQGSDAWRHIQWQRLATAVANNDRSRGAAVLHELIEHVPTVSPGALTLGAQAVRWLPEADRRALATSSREDAPSRWVAALADDPSWRSETFRPLAASEPGGLIGTLATYRAALARLDRGDNAPLRKAAEQFVDDHGDSKLAYVLVHRVNGALGWRAPGPTAELWGKLAEHGAWRVAARYSAGQALYNTGRYEESAEHFLASIDAALDRGEPPLLDYYVQQGITMGRGEASFRHAWSRWRKLAGTTEDLGLRASFVSHAVSLGHVDDVRRVVATVSDDQLDDAEGTLTLADQLVSGGQTQDAWRLVQRLLERDEDAKKDGALLSLASTISEQQGRIADAATYLEQAMALDDDVSLTLPQVRADYQRLMRLHTQLARSPLDADEAAEHRTAALEVAARWRHEDPDNAAIDLACAELFVDDPEQAWRFLSSIIERHPAEGNAYAQVAEALEREARFEPADRVWEDASRVEPTNPTWLLQRAENALALGRDKDALALLDRIDDGEWQERFFQIEQQAKQLLRSVK